MAGETNIPFGKFSPNGADPRELKKIPTDYLQWVLEQDWVEDRYGEELIEEIELVLAERDSMDTHWHEYEEPY